MVEPSIMVAKGEAKVERTMVGAALITEVDLTTSRRARALHFHRASREMALRIPVAIRTTLVSASRTAILLPLHRTNHTIRTSVAISTALHQGMIRILVSLQPAQCLMAA